MPKIVLKQVPPSKLVYSVKIAFEGDESLKDYHILGSESIVGMAGHTFHRIIREAQEGKARHYQVLVKGRNIKGIGIGKEGRVIGFVTIFLEPVKMLYSFGINIKYRKPALLKQLMEQVDALFEGQDYHAGLYEKNRRAINFLERNGFTKINYNAHDKSYYLCRYSEQ